MNPALAYHEYLGPAIFQPCARLTLAVAAIQPTERVLDVACGTGIVASQVKAAKVVGLDINRDMLDVAAKTPGVEWVQGNAMRMELASEAFDVVLCQQGLQFMPDRLEAARELHRVCAKRAVVACWQGLEQQSFMAEVVNAQAKHLGVSVEQAGTPFTLGDADVLGTLLRRGGFSKVDVQAHTIEARFPDPSRFIQMCTTTALATMPKEFRGIDAEAFSAKVTEDVRDAMTRFTVGDTLQFPMMVNVALAFV